MNTIKELDAVALTCDLPEHGLVRGDVGTAVLVHGGDAAFELHLERRVPAMHQHGCANVSAHQPVFGEVAGQSHSIQFFDRVHDFGSGCAVTKRGASLPGWIYQALRTFKR